MLRSSAVCSLLLSTDAGAGTHTPCLVRMCVQYQSHVMCIIDHVTHKTGHMTYKTSHKTHYTGHVIRTCMRCYAHDRSYVTWGNGNVIHVTGMTGHVTCMISLILRLTDEGSYCVCFTGLANGY